MDELGTRPDSVYQSESVTSPPSVGGASASHETALNEADQEADQVGQKAIYTPTQQESKIIKKVAKYVDTIGIGDIFRAKLGSSTAKEKIAAAKTQSNAFETKLNAMFQLKGEYTQLIRDCQSKKAEMERSPYRTPEQVRISNDKIAELTKDLTEIEKFFTPSIELKTNIRAPGGDNINIENLQTKIKERRGEWEKTVSLIQSKQEGLKADHEFKGNLNEFSNRCTKFFKSNNCEAKAMGFSNKEMNGIGGELYDVMANINSCYTNTNDEYKAKSSQGKIEYLNKQFAVLQEKSNQIDQLFQEKIGSLKEQLDANFTENLSAKQKLCTSLKDLGGISSKSDEDAKNNLNILGAVIRLLKNDKNESISNWPVEQQSDAMNLCLMDKEQLTAKLTEMTDSIINNYEAKVKENIVRVILPAIDARMEPLKEGINNLVDKNPEAFAKAKEFEKNMERAICILNKCIGNPDKSTTLTMATFPELQKDVKAAFDQYNKLSKEEQLNFLIQQKNILNEQRGGLEQLYGANTRSMIRDEVSFGVLAGLDDKKVEDLDDDKYIVTSFVKEIAKFASQNFTMNEMRNNQWVKVPVAFTTEMQFFVQSQIIGILDRVNRDDDKSEKEQVKTGVKKEIKFDANSLREAFQEIKDQSNEKFTEAQADRAAEPTENEILALENKVMNPISELLEQKKFGEIIKFINKYSDVNDIQFNPTVYYVKTELLGILNNRSANVDISDLKMELKNAVNRGVKKNFELQKRNADQNAKNEKNIMDNGNSYIEAYLKALSGPKANQIQAVLEKFYKPAVASNSAPNVPESGSIPEEGPKPAEASDSVSKPEVEAEPRPPLRSGLKKRTPEQEAATKNYQETAPEPRPYIRPRGQR